MNTDNIMYCSSMFPVVYCVYSVFVIKQRFRTDKVTTEIQYYTIHFQYDKTHLIKLLDTVEFRSVVDPTYTMS